MNRCAWCDDPCGAAWLCPSCCAVNDHPLFYCKADKRHTVPTLGDSCAECDILAEAKARRVAANAAHLASLRTIRVGLIAEWHKPWPGMEFGKGMFGMMLDSAMKDLES